MRCQLHSIFDKNFSIVRGWTFAKFFFEESKKNVKCRCIEKKIQVSEEKFSKCEEGEKCFKCRVSGVRKKKEIERKVPGKKIKVFLGENLECGILLSSYSLVGLYVDWEIQSHGLILKSKVKITCWKQKWLLVTEKSLMRFFEVFFGSGFVPYTRSGAMLWNMAEI